MSLNYATYVTTLANIAAYSETDADFVQILPSVIDYAEGRIYRETSLLSTTVANSSATILANTRTFTLPTSVGTFSVVDGINIITPSGSDISTGTRNPLVAASREIIDMFWPSAVSAASTDLPSMFAMLTDQTIIVGPPPGSNYTVEVIGTIKPTALSATNTTTYLATNFPELLLAASMVFITGFKANFGAQADNPQQAMSWEGQYKALLEGINLIDAQARFAAASWTSKTPEPLTAAPR